MALTIRHLSGPAAGQEIQINDEMEEIRFGRGIEAEVNFPDDATAVSREHFGLRKEYGGYKFVINPEKPVFMNGQPLYDDQALPKTAEITLGTRNGPRLRIERIEGRGSNQQPTQVLSAQPEMAHAVRTSSARSSRAISLGLGITLLVALLAAGGYFISQALRDDVTTAQGDITNVKGDVAQAKGDITTMQGDIESIQGAVSSITTDLPAVKAQLARIAETNFDAAAIIKANKESVYLVQLYSSSGIELGGGSASVVMLPDGRKALATNSHVAEVYFDTQNPGKDGYGGSLVVVQPKAPEYKTLKVVGVQMHPGYREYDKWLFKQIGRKQAGNSSLDIRVMGYDVALLFVEDPTQLGEPVKMASRETITAMRPGDPLLMIGYPSEGLMGTDIKRPEPTSQTGAVTAMTTFYLSTGGDDVNQLVQHSVPATGGASGSPMFNAKGEVVAYLSAGNLTFMSDAEGRRVRVPSAALVNYGQRADMLLDLAEGKADALMPQIREQMAQAEKNLSLSPEEQLKHLLEIYASIAGGKDNVKLAGEFDGTMSTPMPGLGNKNYVQQMTIEGAGLYFFVFESGDGRPVLGTVMAGSKKRQSNGFAAMTDVGVATNSRLDISVVGTDIEAAVGIAPSGREDGKLKLRIYQLPLPPDAG